MFSREFKVEASVGWGIAFDSSSEGPQAPCGTPRGACANRLRSLESNPASDFPHGPVKRNKFSSFSASNFADQKLRFTSKNSGVATQTRSALSKRPRVASLAPRSNRRIANGSKTKGRPLRGTTNQGGTDGLGRQGSCLPEAVEILESLRTNLALLDEVSVSASRSR
jgi:hypothetical protein